MSGDLWLGLVIGAVGAWISTGIVLGCFLAAFRGQKDLEDARRRRAVTVEGLHVTAPVVDAQRSLWDEMRHTRPPGGAA